MLSGLTEPEQDGAENEDDSGGDADDDGPGEAGGQNRWNRGEWRLWVWIKRENVTSSYHYMQKTKKLTSYAYQFII